jgi:DNA-binding CsgD family transcriptional regulator
VSIRISANLWRMPRARSDVAGLLTLMAEAHDLDGLDPFTPVVLDRVADSLGCEFATYYELDLATGDLSFHVRSSWEEALATWDVPARISSVDLARHRRLGGESQDGVGTWSDFFTRPVRRSYAIGRHEQHGLGHVDMAWMMFRDRRSSARSCWVTLGKRRDFTQAQRDAFLGSRKHVASLIRHVDTRRRLADAMIAIDTDEETGASSVLLLDPSLGIERASAAARRIVTRWFGGFRNDLPEELADWLRSPFPRPPLRLERDGERLVVETPTKSAVVLREERVASVSLTPREHAVMNRIADGMSTNEIAAELCVTAGTVSKHLEHIYRKLGVTGRTAALAALRRAPTT